MKFSEIQSWLNSVGVVAAIYFSWRTHKRQEAERRVIFELTSEQAENIGGWVAHLRITNPLREMIAIREIEPCRRENYELGIHDDDEHDEVYMFRGRVAENLTINFPVLPGARQSLLFQVFPRIKSKDPIRLAVWFSKGTTPHRYTKALVISEPADPAP